MSQLTPSIPPRLSSSCRMEHRRTGVRRPRRVPGVEPGRRSGPNPNLVLELPSSATGAVPAGGSHDARPDRRAPAARGVGPGLGAAPLPAGPRPGRGRRRRTAGPRGTASRSRPAWPSRDCSACTCPRRTAARASACPSWPWRWRNSAARWCPGRSCRPSGQRGPRRGRRDRQAGHRPGRRVRERGGRPGRRPDRLRRRRGRRPRRGPRRSGGLVVEGESGPVLGACPGRPSSSGADRRRRGLGRGRRREPGHHARWTAWT